MHIPPLTGWAWRLVERQISDSESDQVRPNHGCQKTKTRRDFNKSPNLKKKKKIVKKTISCLF